MNLKNIVKIIFAISFLILSITALIFIIKYNPNTIYAASKSISQYDFEEGSKGPILFNKKSGELLYFDGKDLYKSWLFDPIHQRWDELSEVKVLAEQDPNGNIKDFTSLQYKVNSLLDKKKFEKAIKLFKNKELDENDKKLLTRIYYEYGNYYYQNKKMDSKIKYLKAKSCYEKALEYNPTHANSQLNLEIVNEIIKTLQGIDDKPDK